MEPFFVSFVRNTVVLFTSMQTIVAFHQGGSSATSYLLVFGPGRSLCSRRRWSWSQTCRCLLWLLLRVVHKQLLCSWPGCRGRGLFWHSPLVLWGQTVGWGLEAGLCDSGAALMAAVQTALEGRFSSWLEHLAAVCAAQPDPLSASCWVSPAAGVQPSALVPSCDFCSALSSAAHRSVRFVAPDRCYIPGWRWYLVVANCNRSRCGEAAVSVCVWRLAEVTTGVPPHTASAAEMWSCSACSSRPHLLTFS